MKSDDFQPEHPWWDGPLPKPQVRNAGDLREVIACPDCPFEGPLYYMYRDLARTAQERAWLGRHDLRFDITAIPPASLCGEYVKTKGHHHPKNPAGTGYPELYEVLEGRVHYLLQSRDLTDVILVDAMEGDLVVIPPEYGHVSINPAESLLVMSNIVSTRFSSEYTEYEACRGAAYYEMRNEGFIRNMHYPRVPDIRRVDPRVSGHLAGQSIGNLIGDEEALMFLNRPEDFRDLFSRIVKG
ncbi:MAG: glucose-6-phosphate isomerase [Methanoregulaceae archaeon]|nr:glucose-6-phosphate isomerase [Methanoregulaceae archaeon]